MKDFAQILVGEERYTNIFAHKTAVCPSISMWMRFASPAPSSSNTSVPLFIIYKTNYWVKQYNLKKFLRRYMQQNYMISHVQIRTTLGESTGYQSLGCRTRSRGGGGGGVKSLRGHEFHDIEGTRNKKSWGHRSTHQYFQINKHLDLLLN